MKHLFSTISVIAVLLITAACGQRAVPAPAFGHEDLYLNISGTQYSLDINIETVIAALGADYEYSEAQSCDYDGLDKTFVYDMAQFYTYPLTEGDIVNEIYTDSPKVSSSKGICAGASKAQVLAAYGEDCEDTGYQLIYSLPDSEKASGNVSLCFDMENGVVTAIYITALAV